MYKNLAQVYKNNILQNLSNFLSCGKDFLPVYLLLMLSSAPNISESREYFELWGKKKPSPKLFLHSSKGWSIVMSHSQRPTESWVGGTSAYSVYCDLIRMITLSHARNCSWVLPATQSTTLFTTLQQCMNMKNPAYNIFS